MFTRGVWLTPLPAPAWPLFQQIIDEAIHFYLLRFTLEVQDDAVPHGDMRHAPDIVRAHGGAAAHRAPDTRATDERLQAARTAAVGHIAFHRGLHARLVGM